MSHKQIDRSSIHNYHNDTYELTSSQNDQSAQRGPVHMHTNCTNKTSNSALFPTQSTARFPICVHNNLRKAPALNQLSVGHPLSATFTNVDCNNPFHSPNFTGAYSRLNQFAKHATLVTYKSRYDSQVGLLIHHRSGKLVCPS